MLCWFMRVLAVPASGTEPDLSIIQLSDLAYAGCVAWFSYINRLVIGGTFLKRCRDRRSLDGFPVMVIAAVAPNRQHPEVPQIIG